MLQREHIAMRGVAELSTVEAYECCALHVSLLG